MDCIEFSANKDGSVKIERKIAGVVIDRINLTKGKVFAFHKSRAWIEKAFNIFYAPSAKVVIEVPPCPALELNQSERFIELQKQYDEALAIAEHFANLIEAKQIPVKG